MTRGQKVAGGDRLKKTIIFAKNQNHADLRHVDEFLEEIVDHVTEHGCMDAARLYESPYTDFSP